MKKITTDKLSENAATFSYVHNFPKMLLAFPGFFWLFIIIITALTAGEGLAQVSPGIAPVYPPAGGFHIDGDLKANTPVVNKGDWVDGVAGTGGYVLNQNGSTVNPGSTYHLVDKWDDQTDEKFKGGDKFHDNPNTWKYVTSKAVPKLDINNALIHLTTDTTNGQVWVILSADRFSEHGDAYMDFEFYQDSLYLDNIGNFHSDAPASTGGRTVGDFVLTVHFGNNIDTEFEVYRWENTGGTTYDYVQYTSSVPANSVFASSNTVSVPVPYPAFGLNNYIAKTYVEAAVNLSKVLGAINACTDIGITSILIKTKSSHSLTADLDDFIAPLQVTNLSIGNAVAGEAQSKCNEGGYTVFTMDGLAVPSPGYTLVSHTWSVVSYDGTPPNIVTPGALNTDVWVYGTTAKLKLTVVTTNGSNTCSVDDDVELTVIPPVSYGTVASGDETIYIFGNPSNITMSVAPSGGSGTFTYQWYYQDGLVTCPSGTNTTGWTLISGATGSSYDPPAGLAASRTYAVMVDATGTPDCGVPTWATNCRKVTVFNTDPDINATFVNVPVPGDVHTNDDVPAGTTYGTSPTLLSSPGGSTPVITMNPDGTYIFTTNVVGVYVYNVPVCTPGSPCVNEKLTITVTDPVSDLNPPIANTDLATTQQGVAVTLNTLVNDAAGNVGGSLVPSTVSFITTPNSVTEGSVSVNPVDGKVTFTPVSTFIGVVTYKYEICDNSVPALCAQAFQQITVMPAGIKNITDAADDYNETPQGTTLTVLAASGVLANDHDPEGNSQTVTTTSVMTVPGKGTVTIAPDGSYIFVPVPGFTGPVSFPYTVCDNGSPLACANATLYILVKAPDITPNITAEGSVMHGVTHYYLILQITELNLAPTNGLITVIIPKDIRWHFNDPYDPYATEINGHPVNNTDWTYSEDATYHIFTSTAVISAGGFSKFGFFAEWNAEFTTGSYTITSQIVSWSGGENRIDNNVDAEKLDYFIN